MHTITATEAALIDTAGTGLAPRDPVFCFTSGHDDYLNGDGDRRFTVVIVPPPPTRFEKRGHFCTDGYIHLGHKCHGFRWATALAERTDCWHFVTSLPEFPGSKVLTSRYQSDYAITDDFGDLVLVQPQPTATTEAELTAWAEADDHCWHPSEAEYAA